MRRAAVGTHARIAPAAPGWRRPLVPPGVCALAASQGINFNVPANEEHRWQTYLSTELVDYGRSAPNLQGMDDAAVCPLITGIMNARSC